MALTKKIKKKNKIQKGGVPSVQDTYTFFQTYGSNPFILRDKLRELSMFDLGYLRSNLQYTPFAGNSNFLNLINQVIDSKNYFMEQQFRRLPQSVPEQYLTSGEISVNREEEPFIEPEQFVETEELIEPGFLYSEAASSSSPGPSSYVASQNEPSSSMSQGYIPPHKRNQSKQSELSVYSKEFVPLSQRQSQQSRIPSGKQVMQLKHYREEETPNYELSQHAMQRLDERVISENDIVRMLLKNKYKLGDAKKGFSGKVRIYEDVNHKKERIKLITTDNDTPLIITVIKDNDMFSQTALDDMQENNISEDKILEILEQYKPIRVRLEDGSMGNLYIATNDGISISVQTDIHVTKIIGIRFKNMRSRVSQPNDTHVIDFETEGCALQRTGRSITEGTDCGRCAMSYAGIGTPASRSRLQNICADQNQGLSVREETEWLRQYAKKDDEGYSPQSYSINYRQLRDGDLIELAEEVANRLLGLNEMVVASYETSSRDLISGHVFIIAKTNDYDDVWYVCPQQNINPGEVLLRDKLSEYRNLTGIRFTVMPWQSALLKDFNGVHLLENPRLGGNYSKKNKKSKKSNKSKKSKKSNKSKKSKKSKKIRKK